MICNECNYEFVLSAVVFVSRCQSRDERMNEVTVGVNIDV